MCLLYNPVFISALYEGIFLNCSVLWSKVRRHTFDGTQKERCTKMPRSLFISMCTYTSKIRSP